MSFKGQTAWITGASSGIGAALAKALAGQGARLVLSGRKVDALEAVAADCGGDCLILPFETTDIAALAPAVERAWAWSGGIDLLVNNAGISQRSLAVETAYPVYQRIIDVDLLTADGSARGASDSVIDNGIDPQVAAKWMLDAMLADEREIIVAEGGEARMGELRRTPDALFDQVAAMMASGYAEKMKSEAQK